MKSKKGRGLCLFLAAVMLFELSYAAFKTPGFLTRGGGPDGGGTPGWSPSGGGSAGGEGSGTETGIAPLGFSAEDMEELLHTQVEITQQSSPGNPSLIDVRYSAEDYANAPTASAAVSFDQPTASFPSMGVEVDMQWWNLENGADTLIVKELPERTDSATGDLLHTYDFSLASGAHEFYTDTHLKIPRRGGDNLMCDVLYFNEEAGAWEDVYYEVSEDQKYYTVYMSHFSSVAERIRADGQIYMDRYDGRSLFAENLYQEDEFFNRVPRAKRSIYLVGIPEFSKYCLGESARAKHIYELLMQGGGVPDGCGSDEGISALGFVTDTVGAIDSTVDVASTAHMLAKTGSVLSATGTFSWLGLSLTAAGNSILLIRLMNAGDRGIRAAELKERFAVDILGAGLGTAASLLGFTGFCPHVAIGCAIAGIVVYAWNAIDVKGKINNWESMVFDTPQTFDEEVYQQYLLEPNNQVFPGHSLGIRGEGWAGALKELTEKYGSEAGNGLVKTKELNDEVQELFDRYINFFWDEKNQEYREAWATTRRLEGTFTNPGDAEITQYKAMAEQVLRTRLNRLLYELYATELRECFVAMHQELYHYVLPYLNAQILFAPKDTSLSEGKNVHASLYYGYDPVTDTNSGFLAKMEFTDVAGALFYPCNDPARPDKTCLQLEARSNSTFVLETNVYHYLQYGCPEKVKIHGNGADLPDIEGTVKFQNEIARDGKGGALAAIEFDGKYPVLDEYVFFGELYTEGSNYPRGDELFFEALKGVTLKPGPDGIVRVSIGQKTLEVSGESGPDEYEELTGVLSKSNSQSRTLSDFYVEASLAGEQPKLLQAHCSLREHQYFTMDYSWHGSVYTLTEETNRSADLESTGGDFDAVGIASSTIVNPADGKTYAVIAMNLAFYGTETSRSTQHNGPNPAKTWDDKHDVRYAACMIWRSTTPIDG